jgi:putative spermidine/putrescine transport system ATP-binding protein
MSSRIAIYHDGRIEQVGTPEEIYKRPANLFVATFIGESTTFRGHLRRDGVSAFLVSEGLSLPVSDANVKRLGMDYGSPAALIVRPESISLQSPGMPALPSSPQRQVTVRGRMQTCVYLGSVRKNVIELNGGNKALVRVPAETANSIAIEPGCEVDICWEVEAGIVVPRDGEASPPAGATTAVESLDQ